MKLVDDQSFASWESSSMTTGPSTLASSVPKVLSLQVRAQHASVGHFAHKHKTKICVHMEAAEIPEHEQSRSPVDIVAALDDSGSMMGKKIDDCKKTLELMVRHFNSKDRFGLVVYSNRARLLLPICHMTPQNKERALREIKSIRAGGGTNMSAGLSLAAQELSMISTPNSVRSIFLLTDGLANSGLTSTTDLVALVKTIDDNDGAVTQATAVFEQMDVDDAAAKIPAGIVVTPKPQTSLFCFGYGSDHDSETLEAMADASHGGAYYFVEKDEDVASAFGDAMGGLLSVVAQTAVLHLSVPGEVATKGVKILDVFHEQKVRRENGTFTVNVGDFYAEESRDVVLEVALANTPSDTPLPHLAASLTYMDVLHKQSIREGPVICSIGRPASDQVAEPDLHVEEQWLRVSTAQELATADRLAREGRLVEARAVLVSQQQFVADSPAFLAAPLNSEAKGLANDIQDSLGAFASDEAYRSTGTHFVKNCRMKMSKQRGMASVEAHSMATAHVDRYATKTKKKMKGFFSGPQK